MTGLLSSSENSPTITAAIDIGGQSLRIGLYSDNGERLFLCQESLSTDTHTDVNQELHVEQSPKEFIEKFRKLEAKVSNYCQLKSLKLESLGICGPGSSFLCWRRSDLEPLSPIISWQDTRGQKFWRGLDTETSQKITGLRASHHFGAGKYRDCLEHLPAVRQAAKDKDLCIGPIASYLIAPLSPESICAVDAGHAQRSYLWSQHESCEFWSLELCQHFGIKPDYLLNPLTPPVAMEFASQSTQLNFCWRDQGAALFALGAPSSDCIFLNLGTGVFIQCLAHATAPPEGWNIAPLADQDSSKKIWEASINLGSSTLNWLCERLNLTLEQAQALLLDDLEEKNFTGLMSGSPNGLATPFWQPLEPEFFGCNTPQQQLRAWRDNLVFSVTLALEGIQDPKATLIISGGLSQAPGLIDSLSVLTSHNIQRFEDTEASLNGCAYLAAGMSKTWATFQGKRRQTQVFQPKLNNNDQDTIKARYQCWRQRLFERLQAHQQEPL